MDVGDGRSVVRCAWSAVTSRSFKGDRDGGWPRAEGVGLQMGAGSNCLEQAEISINTLW